ncbi:nucleotidyl transferase AbiEii/AbiGii toxin family protein [Aeromicrobium sp.]|uniref:nucleotidyl transferase AbiEii/AbiGii toxin family protein n=1 Tax=Aeromicrobium sp. TaxID=1871063 RepID=UPI002FC7C97E
MSESHADGGQQFAADARQSFETATPGTPTWSEAAAQYATTTEGVKRLKQAAREAEANGGEDRAAALLVAIRRGETLREATAEMARLAAKEGRRLRLQDDLDAVAAKFAVGTEQVRRDHLISHILGALTTMEGADDLTFFGGTALSRTYLPNLRLSEDIDLITRGRRGDMAEAIQATIARGLQRSHGTISWSPAPTTTKGSEPATLVTQDGTRVQVQLLSSDGYEDWPTEKLPLIQRYADAPPATLTTFTPTAFAAVKTATWADRSAPRDLYDIWALGEHGYITAEAATLYRRHGPTGNNPAPDVFREAPSEDAWAEALGHQGRVDIGPEQALERVKLLWAKAAHASP